MDSGKDQVQAEKYKNLGNDAFKVNDYAKSVDLYTQAAELAEGNLLLVSLSNRAFAHIKMENYGLALLDADSIIKIDPSFTKAYYRKGTAHLLLGKFD